MHYKIIYKDGSLSYWNTTPELSSHDILSVDSQYYDKNGYYVAAKSQAYTMFLRDFENNLRAAKRIGAQVVTLPA